MFISSRAVKIIKRRTRQKNVNLHSLSKAHKKFSDLRQRCKNTQQHNLSRQIARCFAPEDQKRNRILRKPRPLCVVSLQLCRRCSRRCRCTCSVVQQLSATLTPPMTLNEWNHVEHRATDRYADAHQVK